MLYNEKNNVIKVVFLLKKENYGLIFMWNVDKIELGSSGRSGFQKGKPPVDKHPKF